MLQHIPSEPVSSPLGPLVAAAAAVGSGIASGVQLLAQVVDSGGSDWGTISLGGALTASVSAVVYFGRAMMTGKLRPEPIDDLLKLLADENRELRELVRASHEREDTYRRLLERGLPR